MGATSQKQWTVLNKDNDFDGLTFGDAPIPKVGENEVLVKFHAASLNFRDLIIPKVRSPSLIVSQLSSCLLRYLPDR